MAPVLLAVGMLGLGLGCAGIVPDMDVSQGSDAEHPADFGLPAPDAGSIETSTTMSMMGRKTTTLTYLMSEGEAKDAIDVYEGALKDMGMNVTRSDAPSPSVTGTGEDGSMFTVSSSAGMEAGQARLAMVSIIPE